MPFRRNKNEESEKQIIEKMNLQGRPTRNKKAK